MKFFGDGKTLALQMITYKRLGCREKEKTCSPLAWQHPTRNPQNRIGKRLNLRDMMKGQTNCGPMSPCRGDLIKKFSSTCNQINFRLHNSILFYSFLFIFFFCFLLCGRSKSQFTSDFLSTGAIQSAKRKQITLFTFTVVKPNWTGFNSSSCWS